MKRTTHLRIAAVLCALVTTFCPSLWAYSGGSGTAGDPYQIATADDLIALGNEPNDYDKHFILTDDIDLAGYTFDRAVIAPDTDSSDGSSEQMVFLGTFWGDQHTIHGLHIKGERYLGLFGYLGRGAAISGIRLQNYFVLGSDQYVSGLVAKNSGYVLMCDVSGEIKGEGIVVGGVVASNFGIVSNCYSSGEVETKGGATLGRGRFGTGGLIGLNAGCVLNSYCDAAVAGAESVGGLIGRNTGSVSTCYSTGKVVGKSAGGLIADNSGCVENSFWDIETSELTESAAGEGLTMAEMQDRDRYLSSGWDFLEESANGMAETWQMSPVSGYPELTIFHGYEGVALQGQGTMMEPFLITNVLELCSIQYRPMGAYRLEADIDCSDMIWRNPIVPWFGGHFDGNGYEVHDLRIQGGGFLGLFGTIDANSVVMNLGLIDGTVIGKGDYVGGLAGLIHTGNIWNCYHVGSVTGHDWVGGLIGRNWGCLQDCSSVGPVAGKGNWIGGLVGYSDGNVSSSYCISEVTGGDWCVGGFAGANSGDSSMSYCWSRGTVEGRGENVGGLVGGNSGDVLYSSSDSVVTGLDENIGGLVGQNSGSISDSESTGMVGAGLGSYVGGLVGYNWYGSVSNCSSSSDVEGRRCVGGLVGYNGVSSRILDSHSHGQVAGMELYVGGLVGGNSGRVSHCYSTSAVRLAPEGECAGGLIGNNSESGDILSCYSAGRVTGGQGIGGLIGSNKGRVQYSFWDTVSSGLTYSSDGAGLTTSEMMDPKWISLQGWANDPNWVLYPYQDYPRLIREESPGQAIPEPNVDWMFGEGTSELPYGINDPNQLLAISKASLLWEMNFILTDDLDLADTLWSQAIFPNFTGIFDGDGHVIKNMRISGNGYLGFWGRLLEGGAVLNVGLLDVDLTATGGNVGGLVAYNYLGSVSNCYSTGSVAGLASNTGGLIGWNDRGNVLNCFSTCTVAGDEEVGGLVGSNWGFVSNCYGAGAVFGERRFVGGLVGINIYDGDISNCYSTGAATGSGFVGGLAGYNLWARISNCYSLGAVSGHDSVGGSVGLNSGGYFARCFWDIETSGSLESDGGTGLTTADMQDMDTYLDAGWDFVGETANGTEDIWWIEEGVDYPRLWWELGE